MQVEVQVQVELQVQVDVEVQVQASRRSMVTVAGGRSGPPEHISHMHRHTG